MDTIICGVVLWIICGDGGDGTHRDDLLLDAADGQHLAGERDLARHGERARGPAQRQRQQRRGDGAAGRRAVLGRGALGHVQVQVAATTPFIIIRFLNVRSLFIYLPCTT